jgi:hypothetical protein
LATANARLSECDRTPLVAVTVTVYDPGAVPLVVETVSVDVPEPMIVAGVNVSFALLTGVALKLTLPENPLSGLTVIV